MKCKSLLAALAAAGLLSVFTPAILMADQGGEGNNTNCSGVGNPNSPCAGQGGGGGTGGGGGGGGGSVGDIVNTNTNTNTNTATGGAVSNSGNSTNHNTNTNNNTNVNANSNTNTNKQQQGQSQSLVNAPVSNVSVPSSAPDAFAPALTAVPETCMGSTSAGASGGNGVMGFGISFGTTWKSSDCELRMFARSLQALGQRDAALALISQNENVRKALQAAGVAIPGDTPPVVTEK